jgi:formylglycine-generating enzyme required for sulfatase activity
MFTKEVFVVRNSLIIGLFCCSALAGGVPDVSSLGGRVIDSATNAGIAGARLSLNKYPRLVTVSDASGGFSFVHAGVLPERPKPGRPDALPRVSGNRLVFGISRQVGRGSLEVYALNGARLAVRTLDGLGAGRYGIELPASRQGAAVVKLTIDNESYVVRSVLGIGGGCFTASFPVGAARRIASVQTSAFTDSLAIFARGYRHRVLGITGYGQSGIVAALTLSNPWKPSGALTHEKGMVKILAKGHDFEIGQPDPFIVSETADTSNMEQPVHTVQFSRDFWLDTTEVTQKDFDSQMKSTYGGYVVPAWQKPFGVGEAYAAYSLTWGDAALYCNARSKHEGLSDTAYRYAKIIGVPGHSCILNGVATDSSKSAYRLPTEAEWEYACKGGGATDFYWGKNAVNYPATSSDTAEIGQYAVWYVNSRKGGETDTNYGVWKVARKKPNAYGLYDMIGNVCEFCNDYFGTYSWNDETDPQGPPLDPNNDQFQVLRGGHWGSEAFYLRSANRLFSAPDYPYNFKGFRTCRQIIE